MTNGSLWPFKTTLEELENFNIIKLKKNYGIILNNFFDIFLTFFVLSVDLFFFSFRGLSFLLLHEGTVVRDYIFVFNILFCVDIYFPLKWTNSIQLLFKKYIIKSLSSTHNKNSQWEVILITEYYTIYNYISTNVILVWDQSHRGILGNESCSFGKGESNIQR